MHKSLLLFALVGLTILFSANISLESTFPPLREDPPELPEIPYTYEQELPDHLRTAFNTRPGMNSMETITDAGATLGRVLFYDQMLSVNNNIACASCHKQEKSFADDLTFSSGVNEPTSRNASHLNDLGWTNRFAFFWDMRVVEMKEAIGLPLADENELGVKDMDMLLEEMENSSYYPELFQEAFGNSSITEDGIKDAIAQFLSSITSFNTRYDRWITEGIGFSEAEIRGLEVFNANCQSCHQDGAPGLFNLINSSLGFEQAFSTYNDVFQNGLLLETTDVGTGLWSEDFNQRFKLPTLRNVKQTAPYMHDGRFQTLEEVLDHYENGVVEEFGGLNTTLIIDGIHFETGEKNDLLAFLETLTDESLLTSEKYSNPFPKVVDPNATIITDIKAIQLFPNPTAGPLFLECPNPNDALIEMHIYSIDGKLLRKATTQRERLFINLTGFNPGLYFCQLMKAGEIWETKKITIL